MQKIDSKTQLNFGKSIIQALNKEPLANYLMHQKFKFVKPAMPNSAEMFDGNHFVQSFNSLNKAIKDATPNYQGPKIEINFSDLKARPMAVFMFKKAFLPRGKVPHDTLLTRKDVGDMFAKLTCYANALTNVPPEMLYGLDKIKFSDDFINNNQLPFVVTINLAVSNKNENDYNLIFTRYLIKSLTINTRGKYVNVPGKKQRIIQDYVYSLSIEDDDLLPTNMNYLFLSTNTVKHFTFDEKGNFKHYSYELKTDSPVDFIHNTDNIIGKIPALYKLNDFWTDNYKSISASDFGTYSISNPYHSFEASGTIKYSMILQNLDKSRSDILCLAIKRLNKVRPFINFNKFSVVELSNFAALTTKLTLKETIRVINWYRNHRKTLAGSFSLGDPNQSNYFEKELIYQVPSVIRAPISNWPKLYHLYLYMHFAKHNPSLLKGNEDEPLHINEQNEAIAQSIQDYANMHYLATNKKIEVNYYSLKRFRNEEQVITEKYELKKARKEEKLNNTEFTIDPKWNRLKQNIKDKSNIILLNTRGKMVKEGIEQHNCVGGLYPQVAKEEKSAFLDYTYNTIRHTVQIDYNKSIDRYEISQMYSTFNKPNAPGAFDELTKLINRK